MSEEELKKILSRAQTVCSRQEKCSTEMYEKMDSWKVEPADCEKIIAVLIQEKFIDESRYAKSYANDKFRFNKWGKRKIVYELKRRKIPELYIQQGLAGIDEEEYFTVLKTMLKSKLRSISYKNQYELRAKLLRFSSGKGFEAELAGRIIDEMISS